MSLSDKTKKWLSKNADISLEGKTAAVTGSNSGVGYKTAEILLYLGANVILACRNTERANGAKASLVKEYPESDITVMQLDLAELSSIDRFVFDITKQKTDIDVFVNNAGVFRQPGKKTNDGFDLVLGTNYFGVYYLTEKLLPYLADLPHDVAYINTISIIHKIAKTDYADFYREKNYNDLSVYAESKLCLAKYTYHKAKEYKNGRLRVYMNHPGIALTPLGLNVIGPKLTKLAGPAGKLFNSIEKSSLSVAYILSHAVPAGSIVGPDRFFGVRGYPKVNRTYRKVKTGADELIAFTEKELERIKKEK